MKYNFIILFLFCFMTISQISYSDGLWIENGRFKGPVVVLDLTIDQKEILKSSRELKLTKYQKDILNKATGIVASEFYVYDVRKGENDCTCSAYNLGVRFSENQMEIALKYLVSDETAKEMENEYSGE